MKLKPKYPLGFYPAMMLIEVVVMYCVFAFLEYDFERFYWRIFWWALITSVVFTILTELATRRKTSV